MQDHPKAIKIDNIEYVPKLGTQPAPKHDGMEYCIVRTYSAGVFAGYVESRDGKEVVMRDARRLWRWEGAASLSELAMHGVKRPEECKFPIAVNIITLTEAIEIIPTTTNAQESIDKVKPWGA